MQVIHPVSEQLQDFLKGFWYLLNTKRSYMKKYILLLVMLPLVSLSADAQSDYKVVFDFTSKDSIDQKSIIRWLDGIAKSDPNARMEVVMYGQGVHLVLKDKSIVRDDITRLAGNQNISFKVCEASLKNNNIDRERLITGVGTVADGIYEVITKQREGWGYIKVKN